MIDLLQIVDTLQKVTVKAIQGDTNGDGKLSLVELLSMGGWLMLPLGILIPGYHFRFCRAVYRY